MPRQKLDIDPNKVEALASYGCTNTEIASFFGCERTTITKRFSRIIAKGKEGGKIRLRQKQFDVAMKGNVVMLIWLGKQILEQSDKQEMKHSGSIKASLSMIDLKKSIEDYDGNSDRNK